MSPSPSKNCIGLRYLQALPDGTHYFTPKCAILIELWKQFNPAYWNLLRTTNKFLNLFPSLPRPSSRLLEPASVVSSGPGGMV